MKENNNNGNDTNVGSMENSTKEDIILLNDFVEGNFKRDKLEYYKGSYKMGYFYYKDIQQALEHILSDYKKLKEEFKAVDHECSRLERKEVEMEKIINLMTKYISNITGCPFESEGAYLNCEEMCDVRTDAECWKQYFINKAKEVK